MKEGNFRQFVIEMGSVLVELPSFEAFTKNAMSSVLEPGLDSAWGYSFLFELGLSLQRGNHSSDVNENRTAQIIVSEFSHFKEVSCIRKNNDLENGPCGHTICTNGKGGPCISTECISFRRRTLTQLVCVALFMKLHAVAC